MCFLTTRLFHGPIETHLDVMIKEAEQQKSTRAGDTTAADADSATPRPGDDPCDFSIAWRGGGEEDRRT